MARDMSFYDEFPSGKIVSRVTSDTQDFANVVTLTLNLMSQVLMVIIIVAILFYINPRLALITMTISPIIVFAALAFRRIARKTTQQARRVLAEVNKNVQETITGISVAKNFRQEQDHLRRIPHRKRSILPGQSAAGVCFRQYLSNFGDHCRGLEQPSWSILAASTCLMARYRRGIGFCLLRVSICSGSR